MELSSNIVSLCANISKDVKEFSDEQYNRIKETFLREYLHFKHIEETQCQQILENKVAIENLVLRYNECVINTYRQFYLQIVGVPFRENENLLDIFNVVKSKIKYDRNIFVSLQRFNHFNTDLIMIQFENVCQKNVFMKQFRLNRQQIFLSNFYPDVKSESDNIIYVNEWLTSTQYNIRKKIVTLRKKGYNIKFKMADGLVMCQFKAQHNYENFYSLQNFRSRVNQNFNTLNI